MVVSATDQPSVAEHFHGARVWVGLIALLPVLSLRGEQAEQYRFLPWESFPESWLGKWLVDLSCDPQEVGCLEALWAAQHICNIIMITLTNPRAYLILPVCFYREMPSPG